MTDAAEQMEKVTQGLIQACNEMNALTRESVNAVIQSTTAVTKGCEELTRNLGDLVQQSVAQTLNTSKALMSAKTLREMVDMQTEFMKECYESWMSGTGKISAISSRVTQEAIEPVANHVNATMSKVTQQAQQHAQGRAA